MKIKIILSLSASLSVALIGHAQTSIPGVFSTGLDGSGNLLLAGQTDPYWTISSSPIGAVPAIVSASLDSHWAANTSSSQWINATGNGDDSEPAGLYIYTLTFSLTGLDPSTAQITGEWASDNQSEIFLNGINTGVSNGTFGYESLASFSVTDDFVAGENELQFYVTQDANGAKQNPEGLQVNIFSATADPVPEPNTLSLLAISMLGSGFAMRRMARRGQGMKS